MTAVLTPPMWSTTHAPHHTGRPPGELEVSWRSTPHPTSTLPPPPPPPPSSPSSTSPPLSLPAHHSTSLVLQNSTSLVLGDSSLVLANSTSALVLEASNASLTLDEGSNASALFPLDSLGDAWASNRSFFPAGGRIRLGVEVELFPDWVVGLWTMILVTLLVVGVGGNLLVPVVVMRTRELRSSTNLLLVNLAAADLLVLVVSLPTALTELHSRPETWVLGQPMCMLVPFVEYCVCHASVLTILVISFERYYAICRPLRASYTCTKMRAWTCILSIWAAAVVLSSPMLVMSTHEWVAYADGSMVPVCYTDLSAMWSCLYINLVTAVFFFVPLVLLVLLYLVIGRSLMQDSASAALHHRKVDLPNMKARKQVVVTLATVTIFFFCSLFPFRVLTLWIVWTPNEVIKDVGPLRYYSLLYAARVLLFANSAVNPILYNVTSTKFREAFVHLLRRDGRRRHRRHLSRQSTFNTTGTSLSNGGRSSSRTTAVATEVASIRDPHPAGRIALVNWGRHASLDAFPCGPPSRPNLARYGRQSSFAGPHPGHTAAIIAASCSRQNSRENGAIAPVDVMRRSPGDDKEEETHQGLTAEARRLLQAEEGSRFSHTSDAEGRTTDTGGRGERCGGGRLALAESRRHQSTIETEMDSLLSEQGPASAETAFGGNHESRLRSDECDDEDDGKKAKAASSETLLGEEGSLGCQILRTKVSLV